MGWGGARKASNPLGVYCFLTPRGGQTRNGKRAPSCDNRDISTREDRGFSLCRATARLGGNRERGHLRDNVRTNT